jgi:hypothetical protein
MPRKPRPKIAQQPTNIDEDVWRWMLDEADTHPLDQNGQPIEDGVDRLALFLIEDRDDERALWRSPVGVEVTEEFARRHAGRRPQGGWKCCAPEPRQRVGGTGVAVWEKYPAYVKHYPYGLPMMHADVDPNDAPRYESQAAYLQRHGLLTASEKRGLKVRDFEPEPIEAE